MNRTRCSWSGDEPLYIEYHDKEWGVPVHDDKKLFEFLILEVAQEFGSFDAHSWRFVDGKPIVNRWRHWKDIPPTSPQSEAFSKDLIKRGFKFTGPTIMYAHMQATGMVNDHIVSCFRYRQCQK